MELYKKYRPKFWGDLIGQQIVADSLRKAVLKNNLPSSLLFCGQRGCGKTSASFLLAKSLNCENLTDDGNPCNTCSTCVAIDNGTQLGVVYVSMANIEGVGALRELLNESRLAQPIKKKVYIIDEIHNASRAAYDSLLIPLERDNTNTLFIFCTTEISKIPDTILSRIQQRRFNLVDKEEMFKYLTKICKKEQADDNPQFVDLGKEKIRSLIIESISKGRGSVRDTLTALDTLLNLDSESVVSFNVNEFLRSIIKKDALKCLEMINVQSKTDDNFKPVLEDIYRNLLARYQESLRDTAKNKEFYGVQGLEFLLKSVSNALIDVAHGVDSKIMTEMFCLKSVEIFKRKNKK